MAKIFGKQFPLTVVIAAAGIVGGILFTFTKGDPKPPPPNQLATPAATPFEHAVSGTGLVEASSRNIELGVFVPGVIDKLLVQEGDQVKAGDVLLAIDRRGAESDLNSAQARLAVAQATLADEEDQYKRIMSLKAGESVSVDQQQRRSFAVKRARAGVEEAKAAVEAAQVFLDKHTIASPIDAEVLKVRVRPGEYIGDINTVAPIVIGSTKPLHLRVQIDENDLWRFDPQAHAVAFLRSNAERKYTLRYVRVEPLVQPKRQLSGDSSQQVDTRVMEVVYEIEPLEGAPLFVGQQLDMFADGAPAREQP